MSEVKPRPRELPLEPEYAVEAGVAHEWNGTLYVPTQEELDRIDRLNAIKNGCREMVAAVQFNTPPSVIDLSPNPYVHGYSGNTKAATRVKMSARGLIRLGATKSKGH